MKPHRKAVSAVVAMSAAATLFLAPVAGAGGGGGAGVSGSGDEIISSILAAGDRGHARSRPGGAAPRCFWRKLTDAQVLYLVHVNASKPELLASGFGDAIEEYLASEVVEEAVAPTTTSPPPADPHLGWHRDTAEGVEAEDVDGGRSTGAQPDRIGGLTFSEPSAGSSSTRVFGDATVRNFALKVRICDGVADTMEVTSEVVTNERARGAAAVRSITTLAGPTVRIAPHGEALLGEPVFFDVARPAFSPRTLTLAGTTVAVRAAPSSLTLFDGQYAHDVGQRISCDFSSGFDPASTETPQQQARREGACVFRYNRTTGDPGDGRPARRDSWVGYARVGWDAYYTITGPAGPSTGSMDGLFSYTLFEVSVGDLEAVLEG